MTKDLDFVDDSILELVLSDVSGRKFVWQLLERAHPFALSFVDGKPDATAFNEGVRFLGTNLLAQIINKHDSLYFQMVKENRKTETMNERTSD